MEEHTETTEEEIAWNPTPQRLARFRAREVEMCAKERRKRPTLRPLDTLFSIATWVASSAVLARGVS